MRIVSQSDNRIVLESETHKAVVSRMLGNKKTDNWLLSAYEKKSISASSSDIETEPNGKRNGTATPQNSSSSTGKGTEVSEKSQTRTDQLSSRSEMRARKVIIQVALVAERSGA